MRVAIVHDWYVSLGGAEKVVREIISCFPDSDLFAIVDFLSEEDRETYLFGKNVNTSFIQHLPKAKTKYRNYLSLMPIAIEQLDVTGYDLIISSSHAVAKGVLTGPNQLHICYCHSPIRYAWDLQFQYLQESGLTSGIKGALARFILHKIRRWDYRTSNSVDHFIANSSFIRRRIKKIYRRDSVVIHPNVSTDDFEVSKVEKEEFYFTASRMVPYKKIDLIVRSFNEMPDKKLVVIGAGPDYEKISRIAGKNVKLLGYQSFSVLKEHMTKAKAFVFAAEEDFGIVPVEAQACGTPVIGFGKGGLKDSVLDGETGIFFHEQNVGAIKDAINRFESSTLLPQEEIRLHSKKFSTDRFHLEFKSFVEEAWKEHLKLID